MNTKYRVSINVTESCGARKWLDVTVDDREDAVKLENKFAAEYLEKWEVTMEHGKGWIVTHKDGYHRFRNCDDGVYYSGMVHEQLHLEPGEEISFLCGTVFKFAEAEHIMFRNGVPLPADPSRINCCDTIDTKSGEWQVEQPQLSNYDCVLATEEEVELYEKLISELIKRSKTK